MKPVLSLPPCARNNLCYQHLSHCTFAVSDGNRLLLIDPFFSGRFTWLGKVERHLDPPAIRLSQIRRCDAVLVSHEHGDHYDAEALRVLLNQTVAVVHAPRAVIADAIRRGLDARRFREVHRNRAFRLGDMKITPLPAAGSERVNPVDRVGFLIEAHGCRLYHQGDSHSFSPSWLRYRGKLDALILWPHRVYEVVNALRPKSVIFHHLDRFKPGNFFCNRTAQIELRYWGHYHPAVHFIVPKRNTWLPVKTN